MIMLVKPEAKTPIITKYHGPTNTRGSRISATDGYGQRVYISYPHEANAHDKHFCAVEELCNRNGWTGELFCGWHKSTHRYWVWADDQSKYTVK